MIVAQLERYALSVADFQRMNGAGLFPPDARLELIDGDIIKRSPIGSRHSGLVGKIQRQLMQRVGTNYFIYSQNPVALGEYTQVQPDITTLPPRADYYMERLPAPADILLAIEVADSTVDHDLHDKPVLYARAGVRELWVVNVPEQLLAVFSAPADTYYTQRQNYTADDQITASFVPGLTIKVADLLG